MYYITLVDKTQTLIGQHNMITEYTNTFLNPLPYEKWYVIYNIDEGNVIEGLALQDEEGVGMLITDKVKYITFDSEEEGREYLNSNSLDDAEELEMKAISQEIEERENGGE